MWAPAATKYKNYASEISWLRFRTGLKAMRPSRVPWSAEALFNNVNAAEEPCQILIRIK